MKKIAIVLGSSLCISSVFAQFLGENIRSGIPSWDAAFIKAGGKFNEPESTKKVSEVIFLVENIRSGIPSWDAAFIKAGGKFSEAPATNK
jgi:hypothetical protein